MQNPVRLIDPDGMDWYSVTENYTDADGNSKTRVVYKYSEQYRSQKDLNKAGIKGKYIGITGYTENKSQYLSLFGEKFNTKTTDGKMNLTAKMVENLDKAIINLYRANYFNDPANREPFDSEIYTFETDMFVKNITQTDKQNYNHIKKFDYAKGQVRYQMANSASGGVFSWGDGKVRPIGGFFDDIIGTGANAIVYRNKAEFRVLNWIFPSTNDWQTTRDKADRLLNNRQW
jgi:hypothetical protein